MRQGDRRRSDKVRIESRHRTSRVTQGAIDAEAELMVGLHLRGCLDKFAIRLEIIFAYDPWPHLLQLRHEVVHLDDEVLDDREMVERADANWTRCKLRQERLA